MNDLGVAQRFVLAWAAGSAALAGAAAASASTARRSREDNSRTASEV